MKENVLFVCIHNSARSQMAEAFLNQICGNEFEAHSAGIEPGKLNPIVVEVMREVGMDISGNQTKSVADMLKSGKTVFLRHHRLRRDQRGTLPDFPRRHHAAALELSRPSAFQGAEKLARTHEVRDAIKKKIQQWCAEVCCLEAA